MSMKTKDVQAGGVKNQMLTTIVVAGLIMAAVGALSYFLSRAYVLQQAEKNITNLLLSHKGIHHYVQKTLIPAYLKYQADGEIPSTFYAPELLSSSYIVRNQHVFYNEERKAAGLPELYYKLAANNPRNPINKADALEDKLITMFNENREVKSYREIIEIEGKKNLYVAIPFLENNQKCLRCHGNRSDSPLQLQQRYPGEGGFNEKIGDIRAITSIRSPIETEYTDIYIIVSAVLAGFMTLGLLFVFNSRLRTLVQKRTQSLEDEITVRTQAEEALKQMNIELNSKNKDLEQILYVASHDLRSPLVNVQGFSKELGRDFTAVMKVLEEAEIPAEAKGQIATLLKEEIPLSLNFILNSVSKMDLLLSGLLRISRLGRAALSINTLEMNKILTQVLSDHEFLVKKNGVKIEIGNLPNCRGDQVQVDQIFANLIGNALKFGDQNRPTVITITGREEENMVVYCVEDNGIGIASAYQEKIFEIFHKLTPTSEGQGLGLNIVRKILDRLGGKVWVESEPGKYCKFFVSLPKA